jgi:hypothetical protein
MMILEEGMIVVGVVVWEYHLCWVNQLHGLI